MTKIIATYSAEMIGSFTAVEGITTAGTVTTIDLLRPTRDPKYQENLVFDEIDPVDGWYRIRHYRYDEKDLRKKYPINQDVFVLDVDSQVILQIDNKKDREHHLKRLPERVCHRKGCDICLKQCLLVPGLNVTVPCCLTQHIPGAVEQEYPLS